MPTHSVFTAALKRVSWPVPVWSAKAEGSWGVAGRARACEGESAGAAQWPSNSPGAWQRCRRAWWFPPPDALAGERARAPPLPLPLSRLCPRLSLDPPSAHWPPAPFHQGMTLPVHLWGGCSFGDSCSRTEPSRGTQRHPKLPPLCSAFHPVSQGPHKAQLAEQQWRPQCNPVAAPRTHLALASSPLRLA